MANILSYLKWRGDICFSDNHPFNELDNLVLARLAYANFRGIVPSPETQQSITISEAAECYLALHTNLEKSSFDDILFHLAAAPRFQNARLSNFVDILDDEKEQTQFAALHITLSDNTVYIAFRGTDFTIVGWREDFMMGYQVVPAQRYAAKYIQDTLHTNGTMYRIGGHSKGGNLSVYAAMMCSDTQKDAITAIYNNDGPGLSSNLLDRAKYNKIKNRVIRIVPEFSIIGMIFENEPSKRIVKSSGRGILQHDLLTWEVSVNKVKQCEILTSQCRMCNDVIDRWMEEVDDVHRVIFVKNLFDALESGGAKTITELAAGGVHSFESVLLAMGKSDPHAKRVVWKLIKNFYLCLRQIDYRSLIKEKQNLQALVVLVIGLFFVALPGAALQSLGTVFFLFLLCYASFQLCRFFCQWRNGQQIKKAKVIIYGSVAGLELVCILYNRIIILSTQWVLFFFLGWYGYKQIKVSFAAKVERKRKWVVLLMDSLLAGTLGLTALAMGAEVNAAYLFMAGSYLTVHGILYGCSLLYKNAVSAMKMK